MAGLNLEIPGFGRLSLTNLVMDLNGTLCVDGALAQGVQEALIRLSRLFNCHVVTADTHGTAKSLFPEGIKVTTIQKGQENQAKEEVIHHLGQQGNVAHSAFGSGRNGSRGNIRTSFTGSGYRSCLSQAGLAAFFATKATVGYT
jgi:soluble P-type ATPase